MEGKPNDDAGLLRRTLDGMPAGVITFDRDGVIVQASASALSNAPSLTPGTRLRPALEKLARVELVDRLLIQRQVATFPGETGGVGYHWMVWGNPNEAGEFVMTFWETDWNEVRHEERAAFTMAASHEMRGPLTTLKGFAEILNLEPENLTREQAEAAEIIERTANHLALLVQDVFDLGQNSFGELRLNLVESDLGSVTASTIQTLAPSIEARGQRIDVSLEEVPELTLDESRVTQMITNLVSNASVHNEPGVTIRVSVRREKTEVAVAVADDGAGLPFEDPRDAITAFRRGSDRSGGDRTGSGIGLTLTNRLIELHRGRLTIESDPGEGTRVTLWFPVDWERAGGIKSRGRSK